MRRLGPILLLLCSLATGVAISEVCYRVARRFVCIGSSSAPVWMLNPVYGWGHRPNGEGWLFECVGKRFEWRVYSRINSHGLLDRERTYEKPAGIRRVLLLGDSVTEAMQVPLEATFATRVEKDLRAGGVPVEVINGGVAAFGTDNELMFFRTEGVRYAPDVVVLVFNAANDVAENVSVLHREMYSAVPELLRPKTYFHLDGDGRLTPDAQPSGSNAAIPSSVSWWGAIENNLYLVRAIHRIAAPSAPGSPSPLGGLSIYDVTKTMPDPEWSQAWAVTEALIRALRADVETTGARFAVAVMPSKEAVVPAAWASVSWLLPASKTAPRDPEYPVTRITEFLQQEGIDYVNLLPPLRRAAERTGETGFFGVDIHLNEKGHVVLASALTPFMASLLPAH